MLSVAIAEQLPSTCLHVLAARFPEAPRISEGLQLVAGFQVRACEEL